MFFTLLSLFVLTRAITLNAPNDWKVGSNNTLTWTSAADDPASFTVELLQPQLLNGPLAIIDQANTSDGTVTFNLPEVPPGDGYMLEAVGISDINNVLDTSDSFSIAPAPSPTTTTTVSTSTAATGTRSSPPNSSSNTTPPTSLSQTTSSPTPTQTGSASERASSLPLSSLIGSLTAASGMLLAIFFAV